jgi:hypothetical protein
MRTILQKIANYLIDKLEVVKNEDDFENIYLMCIKLDDFAIRRGIFLD